MCARATHTKLWRAELCCHTLPQRQRGRHADDLATRHARAQGLGLKAPIRNVAGLQVARSGRARLPRPPAVGPEPSGPARQPVPAIARLPHGKSPAAISAPQWWFALAASEVTRAVALVRASGADSSRLRNASANLSWGRNPLPASESAGFNRRQLSQEGLDYESINSVFAELEERCVAAMKQSGFSRQESMHGMIAVDQHATCLPDRRRAEAHACAVGGAEIEARPEMVEAAMSRTKRRP
jgi:hypothetical protein